MSLRYWKTSSIFIFNEWLISKADVVRKRTLLLSSVGFVLLAPIFQIDPRDEKLDEMERMVASYQEKLDNVTNSYQEKVNILETRLVEKDIDGFASQPNSPSKHYIINNGGGGGYETSDVETDNEDEGPASPVMPTAQMDTSKLIPSTIPEGNEEAEAGGLPTPSPTNVNDDDEGKTKVNQEIGVANGSVPVHN